jgi:hypothetical protein
MSTVSMQYEYLQQVPLCARFMQYSCSPADFCCCHLRGTLILILAGEEEPLFYLLAHIAAQHLFKC